jgi:hypothetical protein
MKRLQIHLYEVNSERRQNEWFGAKGDAAVKRIVGTVIISSAIAAGPAMAQTCNSATTAGMTPAQIKTLVSNKYACVGSSPNA